MNSLQLIIIGMLVLIFVELSCIRRSAIERDFAEKFIAIVGAICVVLGVLGFFFS